MLGFPLYADRVHINRYSIGRNGQHCRFGAHFALGSLRALFRAKAEVPTLWTQDRGVRSRYLWGQENTLDAVRRLLL